MIIFVNNYNFLKDEDTDKKISSPIFLIVAIIFLSFTSNSESSYEAVTVVDSIDIPADVQAVLDAKCTMCHNDEAKGGKSKLKLNFDKFTNGDYSMGKTISKLEKITKQLDKGKMPPQKYLDKYPDKKLSTEESSLLINWASEQSSAFSNE